MNRKPGESDGWQSSLLPFSIRRKLDAQGRLGAHVPCDGCGYDLYLVDVNTACPECGLRIRDTLVRIGASPIFNSNWTLCWFAAAIAGFAGCLVFQWLRVSFQIASPLFELQIAATIALAVAATRLTFDALTKRKLTSATVAVMALCLTCMAVALVLREY